MGRIGTDRSIGSPRALAVALLACGAGGMLAIGAGTDPRPNIALSQEAAALTARRFQFDYTVEISDLPADTEQARLWIPLPIDDAHQVSRLVRITVDPPMAVDVATDPEWGNEALLLEWTGREQPAKLTVTATFEFERQLAQSRRDAKDLPPRDRMLKGDALAPITDEVRTRAKEATRGQATTLEKARAIYDRVLADVAYDKSGTGWGRGDIDYVCEVGKGNCSDFHTLFISMARAAGIPAYFEIGFPVPDGEGGEIGGYHCWAWFYDDGAGEWRPVDASEADKNPAMTDFYFGTLGPARAVFTRGRDLAFDDAPGSGPVNFFIYPILEIDGKDASASVKRAFQYREQEVR